MVKIEKLSEHPKEITRVFVEAVAMPNGEIIANGRTISWYDVGIVLYAEVKTLQHEPLAQTLGQHGIEHDDFRPTREEVESR